MKELVAVGVATAAVEVEVHQVARIILMLAQVDVHDDDSAEPTVLQAVHSPFSVGASMITVELHQTALVKLETVSPAPIAAPITVPLMMAALSSHSLEDV